MKHKLGLSEPNTIFIIDHFPEHVWYMWYNIQVGHATILKHLYRAMLYDQLELFFSWHLASRPFMETILRLISSDNTPITFKVEIASLP